MFPSGVYVYDMCGIWLFYCVNFDSVSLHVEFVYLVNESPRWWGTVERVNQRDDKGG